MLAPLLASLAIAPGITYETVAKPIASVLEDLSKQSGHPMKAAESIEHDLMVMRVEDVRLEDLRKRIAEAMCASWATQRDGSLLLRHDPILRRKRLDAIYENRAALYLEQLDDLAERGGHALPNGLEAPGSRLSEYRFYANVMRRMNLKDVAALPTMGKAVYSNAPTRMQKPLPMRIDHLVQQLIEEHNTEAEKLEATAPSYEVGSREYAVFQHQVRRWSAPLRVVVKFIRNDPFVSADVSVFDSEGQGVAEISGSLVDRTFFRPPDELLDAPNADKIPLSPTARAFAKLYMDISANQMMQGSFVIPEPIRDVLRKPAENEPLQYHVSETLIGLSRALKRQLVARVDDSMVQRMMSETPTVGEMIAYYFYTDVIWTALPEGWLVVGEGTGVDIPLDRHALQALIAKCESRLPTLDEMASLAARSPQPRAHIILRPYSTLFFGSYYARLREWEALRAYDTLTTAQKLQLREGRSLSVSSLLPASRSAVSRLIFETGYERTDDEGGLAVPAALQYLYPTRDSTDLMPNGLTPNTAISLEAKTEPMALPAPQLDGATPGVVVDTWMLAVYRTTTSPTGPQIDRFFEGEQTEFKFIVQPAEHLRFFDTMHEFRADKRGEPRTVSTASPAFRKAYEEAEAERRRRAGGG